MNLFKSTKNDFSPSCEDVIKMYSDTVYKVALSTMKNEADAQDIFQEVFLRYVKYKNGFSSAQHLKAWLIRVTLNCCNTMHTTKKRKDGLELTMDIAQEEEVDTGSMRYLVETMEERYRIVIHLFYYEEYAVKDIAHILKESEGAIKTRLYRARVMLKDKWEDENDA